MNNISCIIPAYNEEKNIRNTLVAIQDVSSFLETIVVDDGSTDNTRDIVSEFPSVKLYSQSNAGKSNAVATGISAAQGKYIMLLDADLKGISKEAIEKLIAPILSNKAEVSISMRANTPLWMKMLSIDFMSGERVFPKQMVMSSLDTMKKLRGFALEMYLNKLILKHRYTIASVSWAQVHNDLKWNKRGLWRGLWGEIKMWRDVFSVTSPFSFIQEALSLSKLVHEKQNLQ